MKTEVLITTADGAAARFLHTALCCAGDEFHVACALTLGEGLQRMLQQHFDLLMLATDLPDVCDADSFHDFLVAAGARPVLLIGGAADPCLARELLRRGAIGYLQNDALGCTLLPQFLHNLIVRSRLERELSLERKRNKSRLDRNLLHLAQHDYLTDLPNRMLFNDRLGHAIALAARNHTELAVLFLDLDNFKQINDAFGHPVGDALLKSVAARLLACTRQSDSVSRHGGDEFVALIVDERSGASAALMAEKILAALALPHRIGTLELEVGASIGISVYPTDGSDAEALIGNADAAMYRAKNSGRATYRFYKRDLQAGARTRDVFAGDVPVTASVAGLRRAGKY